MSEIKCPACGEIVQWILIVKGEEDYVATYGCAKKCSEKIKATFGELKHG